MRVAALVSRRVSSLKSQSFWRRRLMAASVGGGGMRRVRAGQRRLAERMRCAASSTLARKRVERSASLRMASWARWTSSRLWQTR